MFRHRSPLAIGVTQYQMQACIHPHELASVFKELFFMINLIMTSVNECNIWFKH